MTQLPTEAASDPVAPPPPGPVPAGPVPAGPMARSADPASATPGPSRMVALTNWLVSKATGALEKRTSRRGFLVGSAMVGSAVAVSGCMVATQPGTPFNHITDCAGGLCADGYTEFCCVINDGVNACPPDSFAGGWWRADNASYCGGNTRYYIDCMQYCCGPKTGYQNFCAGCQECRCAGNCNTRKVYCTYFRYGQCHQEIAETGPIACRVVTCVPPYEVEEFACSTAAAVDNGTRDHWTDCLGTLPRVPVLASGGTVFEHDPGAFTVSTRTNGGNIDARVFDSAVWLDPVTVLTGISSAPTSAVDSSGSYVFGRGVGTALYYNRLQNGAWQGQTTPGVVPLTADPVALTVNNQIHVFVRSGNNAVFQGRLANGVWQGWQSLEGYATSNLTVAANGQGIFLFARGYDGALWYRRFVNGVWGPWASLGGNLSSDPSAVADGGAIWVFARSSGRQIVYRRFAGGWSGWQGIGGSVLGDPKAIMGLFGPIVFGRDDQGTVWHNAVSFGVGTSWQVMWNFDTTNVNPFGAFTRRGTVTFMVGRDGTLYRGTIEQAFTGWWPLGGTYAPITAA